MFFPLVLFAGSIDCIKYNFICMHLEFLITEPFDNDMKSLLPVLQKRIKKTINSISGSLLNGKDKFTGRASMPHSFNLKDGLTSSLYLVEVGEGKKMIVAVDDDPIFDKLSLTLFRLVDNEKGDSVYKEIGQRLYKNQGLLK